METRPVLTRLFFILLSYRSDTRGFRALLLFTSMARITVAAPIRNISTCEYTLAGCLSVRLIRNDAFMLVDLKSACCGNQRTASSGKSADSGKCREP